MPKKLVIIGWGELADIAAEYFSADTEYNVVAFAAEQSYIEKAGLPTMAEGKRVISLEAMQREFPAEEYDAFVAIGYSKLNYGRSRLYDRVKAMEYHLASYVSPKAFVGIGAAIGENCFILEQNVIQRNVTIGNDTFLWSGNHVGHGSIIKEHVFLASQVVVSGNCTICEHCFLGIHSGIGDRVTVARDCWIGAGVTLVHDTKENEIYRESLVQPERLPARMVFGLKH